MKPFLLLLSTALFAGSYSGTVTDLTGAGLAGVTISSTGFSAVSDAQGRWALGAGIGVIPKVAKPIPVIQNMVIENGRLRLSWRGVNLQGRSLGGQAPIVRSVLAAGAPRSAVIDTRDTLLVQWHGKLLTRLSVPYDSTGIVFAIDTGWSDDGGIAWNAHIPYGSVDFAGQRYRTVQIGRRTWMAENLNFAGSGAGIGSCFGGSVDSCPKYGRLYTWDEVMAGSPSSSTGPSGARGICPTGWHVPSDAEWTSMQIQVDPTNTVDATSLKSNGGWVSPWMTPMNGSDAFGFRVLPGGQMMAGKAPGFRTTGTWWSATKSDSSNAWSRSIQGPSVSRNSADQKFGLSLRCVMNPNATTSSDSTLSSLRTGAGLLSPAFSPNRVEYIDILPAGVTVETFSILPTDSRSTVTYDGSSIPKATLGSDGKRSLAITVTNANGNSLTYTLQILSENLSVTSLRLGSDYLKNDGITSYPIYGQLAERLPGFVTKLSVTDSLGDASTHFTIPSIGIPAQATSFDLQADGKANLIAKSTAHDGSYSLVLSVTSSLGSVVTTTVQFKVTMDTVLNSTFGPFSVGGFGVVPGSFLRLTDTPTVYQAGAAGSNGGKIDLICKANALGQASLESSSLAKQNGDLQNETSIIGKVTLIAPYTGPLPATIGQAKAALSGTTSQSVVLANNASYVVQLSDGSCAILSVTDLVGSGDKVTFTLKVSAR